MIHQIYSERNNTIRDIRAHSVYDSRGWPTVEVEVRLANDATGRAIAPAGASRGRYEAVELRDGEKALFGKTVDQAVAHVNGEIFQTLSGLLATEQLKIDHTLCALDGSENKSRLGANAILAVSLAVAHAAARAMGVSLWRYLGGAGAHLLPTPMINIINGGVHGDNPIDIQEFMIVPHKASCFREALGWSAEIFHHLRIALQDDGHNVNVGDEGGFAPRLANGDMAVLYILRAIEASGRKPGEEVSLAIDAAASEWKQEQHYHLKGEDKIFDSDEMVKYWQNFVQQYPIVSLEDAMGEDDWQGWQNLTRTIGAQCQLVGDDLYVTNPDRLRQGIARKAGNAILVKPNQIGTLSQTLDSIEIAKRAGFGVILSHRSGESEDTTIADLAVASNCGQIKTGSLARSERLAKYNQLLRIERELGDMARYQGKIF